MWIMIKARQFLMIALFITVVVMADLALVLSVQADELTVTKSLSKRQQAAASSYWTRERIATAPAMPLLIDKGHGGIDSAAQDEAFVAGQVGSEPAGIADPYADKIAASVYSQDWSALERASDTEEGLMPDGPFDVEAGTAGVYTYFDVNIVTAFWNIYPHKWDGKLTFTTASGGASCSATAISKNNIVTAAHCVYDTTANKFYSNWVFTPAYRNGSAPYGTFTAKFCTVLNAWVNLTGSYSINTWARHDVAVCTMNNNSTGQTLNAAVGWAGRLWNASYQQLNFNSGYPARIYTDATISVGPAQYLRACINESFAQTTETLGGGCYWGRGISGGSWLIAYKPFVVSGNVNSVNSGLFIGQQNLYGARFNSSNIVPLCTARSC